MCEEFSKAAFAGATVSEKSVLITGGRGFIGRYLVNELLDGGYKVRVLDSLVPQVHGHTDVLPDDRVGFLEGDVRDAGAVRRALEGVEAVVHLAAEVGVGQSMYEIARYVGANDLGTAVLLECLIEHPVQRIVVASSMSVYGEGLYETQSGEVRTNARRDRKLLQSGRWNPLDSDGSELIPIATDESKPVDLASLYALTKYAQERAVLIFAEAYGLEAVALRLFNVFGPGQALSNPYTGVLANFASRLANGQKPIVFEDGNQRRDFVHVKDVARAFRLALEQPDVAGQTINIGSGSSYAIKDVAVLLAEAMEVAHLQPEILNKARSGDIRNCFADISTARQRLGYQPRYRLEHFLAEFASWVCETRAVDGGTEMRRELEARGLVS